MGIKNYNIGLKFNNFITNKGIIILLKKKMSKMRSERKRTSVSMVANYEDNSSPKERNSYY